MSGPEIVWAFGPVAAILIASRIFQGHPRTIAALAKSAEVQALLPAWVRVFQGVTLLIVFLAMVFGLLWVITHFLGPARTRAIDGAGATWFAIGLIMIPSVPAALAANLIIWIIPPIRSAHLRAAEAGLSMRSQNRILLCAGAVAVPVGLALIGGSVLAPWK